MTLGQDSGLSTSQSTEAGGAGRTAVQDVREGAANVAASGTDGVREIAEEVGQQAKEVASEAKRQLDQVVSQGREELRQQMDQRSAQMAGQLRSLSQQFRALAQGNTQEAGPLLGYLNDAQAQVQRLATRLESGGPQGVVDDVSRFARRRPGIFLLSAIGAGFLAGRVVRAGSAVREDTEGTASASVGSSPSYNPTGAGTLPQENFSPTQAAAGAAP